MSYDADHRERILEAIRSACVANEFERAATLVQQAAATLRTKNRRIPLELLRSGIGATCADRLVKWCTVRPCMYCQGGREQCESCRGTGQEQNAQVCQVCGGFGMRRCPFCNGTSFAGYDFVPEGLRVAVMSCRVRLALARIAKLRRRELASECDRDKLIREVIDLDRCRGVLANAFEHVGGGDVTTPGAALYAHSTVMRVQSMCRSANAAAERVIRTYLHALAPRNAPAVPTDQGSATGLGVSSPRATHFASLARARHLAPSALETPFVFRDE